MFDLHIKTLGHVFIPDYTDEEAGIPCFVIAWNREERNAPSECPEILLSCAHKEIQLQHPKLAERARMGQLSPQQLRVHLTER